MDAIYIGGLMGAVGLFFCVLGIFAELLPPDEAADARQRNQARPWR